MGTPFQQTLGLRWTVGDMSDSVSVEMDLREHLCGPAGSLEGGVVSTLVDVAGASAAASVTGKLVATQSLSVSFLAPGRVGPIRANGSVLRVGKHDVVSEVRVVDLGQDDRLMAVGIVTLKIFDQSVR